MKIDGYLYLKYISEYVGLVARAFGLISKVINKSNAFVFHPLIKFLTSRYHGKVMILEDARKIINLGESVTVPEDVAKSVIPYEMAYNIIIRNPHSIVALRCACRDARGHDCQPAHKCMIIGEPFMSFMLEQNKKAEPVQLTAEEAIELLNTCKKNGFVSNAYCKDGAGNQMYAICNCCPECCVSISAVRLFRLLGIKERSLAQSGYLPEIDLEKCTSMGKCVSICPFDALSWGDINKKYPVVDSNLCMGCGNCAQACPETAIVMTPSADKGIPLDIDKLAS
ncbi:MAG TPA: 4Fe-4S binding protein [Smithella sp.]|nr:4Fe-4S binding protein [Smithella sp.]